MKKKFIFLVIFLFTTIYVYSQQFLNTKQSAPKLSNGQSINKSPVYIPDTSEKGLVKDFRDKMDNSATVFDAQVISMESKWDSSKKFGSSDSIKEIYTIITFKVFNWIKGSIKSDSVNFYLEGGKIGNIKEWISIAPLFHLNERAIFFLKNKKPNTFITNDKSVSRIPIWGAENGKQGTLAVGLYKINTDDYVNILKKSIADSSVYPQYIHQLKLSEERFRSGVVRYKDRLKHPDSISVHQEVMKKWWKMHQQMLKTKEDLTSNNDK
jgi:hypothetical protein